MKIDIDKPYLDAQEVLFMLNISQRTLHKFRGNGTIPHTRIGGKILYRTADIEKILQSNYSRKFKPL